MLCCFVSSVLIASCEPAPAPETTKAQNSPSADHSATWVGTETCAGCHQQEHRAWAESHHAKAMLAVSETTVLATPFEYTVGDTTLTVRDGERTAVTDDGAYPVTHTFGISPLQQYLADTGNGRLQTLRASWNARAAESGGQRWFHQFPNETIEAGDPLHWQGLAYNWNSSCADCHVTGFEKNYQVDSDSYQSTYSEMGAGCESCHGPGSAHAKNPTLPMPATAVLTDPKQQPEVCAACHARRSQLAEGFTAGEPLLNHYLPELLNPPLYHADGQINDEVFVYGSFIASRMHQQGVTCGDCHNSHTGALKTTGDKLCQQCHSPAGNPRFPSLLKKDYVDTAHHLHAPDSEAARCTTCHMPDKTYMGIDQRGDHSFRIPRPDLAGVPNPCVACHTEVPDWPRPLKPNYADIFVQPAIAVESELVRLSQNRELNSMLRATALSRLGQATSGAAQRAIETNSRDNDGLLRHTSTSLIQLLPEQRQVGAFRRLLSDELLAVRSSAAFAAASHLNASAQARLQPALNEALIEYRATQALHLDQPQAWVNLASLARLEGNLAQADEQLAKALQLQPGYVPALLNVADLRRLQNRDADAETYLVEAVSGTSTVAAADYAYAMWLVRNGSRALALVHLRRAYQAEPENPQWSYAYVIALHSLGQTDQALRLLRQLDGQPIYQEQLMFLHASIARDVSQGNPEILVEAHRVVDQLLLRHPSNPRYLTLKNGLPALP